MPCMLVVTFPCNRDKEYAVFAVRGRRRFQSRARM